MPDKSPAPLNIYIHPDPARSLVEEGKHLYEARGLTLFDYYVAAALSGSLADGSCEPVKLAKFAAQCAYELLKVRQEYLDKCNIAD